MNIYSFGSRIMDDAIVKFNHNNRMRIRGISPFSVAFEAIGKIELSADDISNDYRKKIILIDLNKSLCLQGDYDYIVVDFAEAFKKLKEISFVNGEKIRFTEALELKKIEDKIEKQLCIATGEEIVNKESIDPLLWKDTEINKEVEKFCNWLLGKFPAEKVILLENTIPYHIKSEKGLGTIEDYKELDKIKKFIKLCESAFKDNIDCKIIPSVLLSLGAESCSIDNLKYGSAYYQYVIDMLLNIDADSFKKDEILKCYNRLLQEEIDLCLIDDIVMRAIKYQGNRKVILVGGSRNLVEYIEKKYNLKIAKRYDYYEITNSSDLYIQLKEYKDRYSEFLFIIPHLYVDKLLQILYGYNYFKDRDVFLPQHESIIINRFKGEYVDIFHNKVICRKEVNLYISGIAGNIVIEESNKSLYEIDILLRDQVNIHIGKDVSGHLLKIYTLESSAVRIEKDVTFADNCTIFTVFGSKVEIGDDSMFSSKVIIHAGDGHSIFDIDSGVKISGTPSILGSSKNEVIIGKHVWVGYQAFLLCGCNVGTGSIVGARSVIKKSFPNNCIIAGSNARVIKRDIGWARDPFITNIYEENIDNDFLNFTV